MCTSAIHIFQQNRVFVIWASSDYFLLISALTLRKSWRAGRILWIGLFLARTPFLNANGFVKSRSSDSNLQWSVSWAFQIEVGSDEWKQIKVDRGNRYIFKVPTQFFWKIFHHLIETERKLKGKQRRFGTLTKHFNLLASRDQ